MRSKFLIVASLCLVLGCGERDTVDLCAKYSLVYPDIISGREETVRNKELMAGMQDYNKKDYTKAIAHFDKHLATFPKEAAAYLYKASSELQLQEPFKAELTLDHLERLPDPAFTDQMDYYNLMCLICSAQYERAQLLAERISNGRVHTYSEQAYEILSDLNDLE